MSEVDPRDMIERALAGWLAPGERPYPGDLPAELVPWHCYTVDGGHSLVVALAVLTPGTPTQMDLVPAPVKAVLREGWEIRDGFVVSDLPYDRDLGLLTKPDDDEY